MAFVHVVLLWGTNNTITTGFTEEEIENREYGSRFVLASRVFYAATYVVAFRLIPKSTCPNANVDTDYGC